MANGWVMTPSPASSQQMDMGIPPSGTAIAGCVISVVTAVALLAICIVWANNGSCPRRR